MGVDTAVFCLPVFVQLDFHIPVDFDFRAGLFGQVDGGESIRLASAQLQATSSDCRRIDAGGWNCSANDLILRKLRRLFPGK